MIEPSRRVAMMEARSEPQCCPWVTEEVVRKWLYHIRICKLSRVDPVESARAYGNPREDRHMGRGGLGGDGMRDEDEVIAVLQALPEGCTIQQLQRFHADPSEIMKRICPRSGRIDN